jgi:outer membrane protein insertion porin family
MLDESSNEMTFGWESSVSPFLIYDTRDDEINPSQGRYYDFRITLAGKKIGSKEDFAKLGIDLCHYFNLGSDRQILAFRARAGYAIGNLPYHAKYNLGGGNSMRGYPSGRFIGTREILFNTEYRLNLFRGLPSFIPNLRWDYGIGAFVDIGRTWSKGDGLFSLDDFNISYGIGQRVYFSPIIVLRFDYGVVARGGNKGFYFGASHLF